MHFKPMKLSSIKVEAPTLRHRDSDYDGVPDKDDCNPYNPLQQDNGNIKVTDYEYIPPNEGTLGPVQYDTESSRQRANDRERTVISNAEEDRTRLRDVLKRKGTEESEMKKAKQAYDTAYGDNIFLFIKKRDGNWVRAKEYSSQEFNDIGYEAHRFADEILKNPVYTDYKFTTDKYFSQRQQVERIDEQKKQRQMAQTKANVRGAFKLSDEEKKRLARDRQSYAQGPNTSALFRSPTPASYRRQQSIPSQTGQVERDYDDYNSSQQPVLDMQQARLKKPLGYQEESPFGPFVIPYRPTRGAYVGKPTPKPLFKPPFLRRI